MIKRVFRYAMHSESQCELKRPRDQKTLTMASGYSGRKVQSSLSNFRELRKGLCDVQTGKLFTRLGGDDLLDCRPAIGCPHS